MNVSWSAAYFEGDHATFRVSGEWEWRDLPVERVLWVDVMWSGWAQRLQGRDYFWVHGDQFGMFNHPANLAWYGGNPHEQFGAWRMTRYGSEVVTPAVVPEAARVLSGVLVPDDVWMEVTRAHPLVLA